MLFVNWCFKSTTNTLVFVFDLDHTLCKFILVEQNWDFCGRVVLVLGEHMAAFWEEGWPCLRVSGLSCASFQRGMLALLFALGFLT